MNPCRAIINMLLSKDMKRQLSEPVLGLSILGYCSNMADCMEEDLLPLTVS